MNLNHWARARRVRKLAEAARRRKAKLSAWRPVFEPMEERTLFSVEPLAAIRTIDGTGNNRQNPTWGSAGSDLLRSIVSSNYADGVSTPNGQSLPSAREISNIVGAQTVDIPNTGRLSAFIYAWGQFIDHDLDRTPDGGTSAPISVPAGDPQFDPTALGGQTLPFTRSITDPTTGKSTSNPLNQPTVVTSFIDGSQVYGSDAARAAALRTFSGGQLMTSAGDLLPFNTAGLANANNGPFPNSQLFLAGDIRANENIELTALQTLFMREHNRQAGILQQSHPQWTDEQLYQGARQIVIAEIQSITYNEFLPALLGSNALTRYTGYNSNANPGIAPEFSEAAFRFGHSQLDNEVKFVTNNGSNLAFSYTAADGTQVQVNSPAQIAAGDTGVPLLDAFFNPSFVEQPGVMGSILKYLSSDIAQTVDLKMVDAVRNVLFGAPGSGAGGMDLFALDIQRGRDVGLPTFNEARVAYGLPAVTSFSQISSDPQAQAELQQIYGTVDKVELFVGGLAENHAPGSSMGATFTAIIANQFERTRDGDRFWYQNVFSGAALRNIQNTKLADIISANTDITNLQSDVFIFKTSISGQVLTNYDGNGRHDRRDQGLAGRTIELLDSSGNVLATTLTGADGRYRFSGLDLGAYQVREVTANGLAAPTTGPSTVQITRGMAMTNINFGLTVRPGRPVPTPPWWHNHEEISTWLTADDLS